MTRTQKLALAGVALLVLVVVLLLRPYLHLSHLFKFKEDPPAMSRRQVRATESSIKADTAGARKLGQQAAAAHDTATKLATRGRAAAGAAIQLLHPPRPSKANAPRHATLTSTSSHADSVALYQRLFAD